MDEIEYKLNTNNSVLVVNAIEKLINTIKLKFKPAEKQKFAFDNEELKLLRDKCSSKEALLSLTACQGILSLVENGVLDIAQTMSTMISILPTAQNYSAIINTMGGLLVLDLKSRLWPGQVYECQLSLRSPQHPFITVLERNSEVAGDILSQMQALCLQPDFTIAQNSLELLRAVFLWLVCNPQESKSAECRQNCWQLLLSLGENKAQAPLVLECISWQQVRRPKQSQAAFAIYSTLAEAAVYQKQKDYVVALVPVLARMSTHFIRHGYDPRPCYNIIDRCFSSGEPELRVVAGITVILLAENLVSSPALYLHELFNLCYKIISKYQCSSISLNTFVALSLQWLHYPSHLTANALKVAAKIMDIYQNRTADDSKLCMPTLYANKIFQVLVHADNHLFTMFRLCRTWERVKDDHAKVCEWLDSIDGNIDQNIKLEVVPFLLGILLERHKGSDFEKISLKALSIALNLAKDRKDMVVVVLPILLYKIASESLPILQLECLKAIPLMAQTKENVPAVVAILTTIKSGHGAPASLMLALYMSLVVVQGRCYPYLQELLTESSTPKSHLDLKWEIEIAKATAVKKICETRAASYGAELVSVLSGLLNRCTDAAGALPSSIALDALRALWLEHIVSPPSTWYALAPKMSRDKRPAVQISLCKLLAEVPALRVQSPEYDKFVTDAARRLWTYIAEAGSAEVVVAACKALAGFKLEDFTLKDVPEVYRKGVKLPAAYCKTPADAARSPEDVLDYIPSEVWPNVYKYTNQCALHGVRTLCASYMDREIKGYRSGVYQRESKAGEPSSMHYLPPHSVVQGMCEYVRKQAVTPSYDCPDALLLEMLATLTWEFPRPLPPLDLCFLHDLFHRGAHFREPCLLLGARQALVSGSAKRFIENYLTTFEPQEGNETDILVLFQILPHLCRSIPPNVLRGPLDKCINHAYTLLVNMKEKPVDLTEVNNIMFVQQVKLLRECLLNDKIHDANRTLLSQIIENYFPLMSDDSVAWPSFVETCCVLSSACLERMSSPSSWWEVTPALVRAAAGVRAVLACGSLAAPLLWLNEAIDAAVTCPTEHMYVLRCILPALKKARVDEPTRDWLLQLMARTQIAIAESSEETSLTFLCDVLMLSVVVIAGFSALEPGAEESVLISRELRCLLFPNAIAALVSDDRPKEWQDSAVQVIEWLHHTRGVSAVPAGYRRAFYLGLVATRHSAHFSQPHTWTKVLSIKPCALRNAT